jgi:hypothetical protein
MQNENTLAGLDFHVESLESLEAAGWFKDFGKGFKQGFGAAVAIGGAVAIGVSIAT